MTLEYVLLIFLFVVFIGSTLIKGPNDAFKNGGPLLGARLEKHLSTGDGFSKANGNLKWTPKKD